MPRAKLRRYFRHGLFPQLIVFEAVARLGSVTRAAEELHLAQPTVSMQIKKLAETLEVPLFEQRGRKLYLTAAGEEVRRLCLETIACVSKAEERIAALRAAKPEVLRLAAEPEARAVAARLVADFCARHPGVQASLHIAERAELLSRFSVARDDVYLFELEIDGLPPERRWNVVQAKGRALAQAAVLFLRESLQSDAYNSQPTVEDGEWRPRGDTTRR
jgi:LysR family transcriptional regulator, low CO2-responsive transcriptional regulator